MTSPEANTGAPTSPETLHGIVFEPLIIGGKPSGWKSPSPDRKMVKLHQSSVTPRIGVKYEVEIVEDTNPGDPAKGVYYVRIKDDAHPLTVEEEKAWHERDAAVDTAEGLMREAAQSSKAAKELGAVDEAQKAAAEAEGEEKMKKFPGVNKKTKGKTTRLKNKFGPKEGSLVGDVLRETIEGAKKTTDELLKQSGELLSRTPEGKAEPGRETEFTATEALVALRKKNLKDAVEKISYLEGERDELVALKLEMRKSFTRKSAKNQIISSAELDAYKKLEERTAKIDEDVEAETQKTPEAWYGYNIKKLREYRKQYSEGKIVELPSVMEKAEKIASRLVAGQPVFIHGHLGSGKTELARYISTNYLGKNFHMISGSRHMSPSEIYGHDILTVSNDIEDDSNQSLDKRIETRLNVWEQENSDRLAKLDVNEREGERNRAQQRIIASLEAGATISEFYTGPIYRAMENGEPLIIDELNAIPHDILIGLNDLLTKRPGDKVKIQQDSGREITVGEGYCVIMTGNLNTGDLQRYVDRKDLDPAFVSRLHSEEYDYLPQKKEGLYGEQNEDDELFTLMNVMVMDRQGNIKLPEKSIEKMWNLAKASKIFQDVFSNKQIDSKWFLQTSGVTTSKKPELHSTVMSLRNLKRIFDEWRNDGYSKELDYYIYENFIGTSTNPNDKAYIYQILQKQFGFFQSDGWNQTPNFGDGKASLPSFDIEVPSNNLNSPLVFMSPRATVDAVFGDKAPERKTWPRVSILTEMDAEEVADALPNPHILHIDPQPGFGQ